MTQVATLEKLLTKPATNGHVAVHEPIDWDAIITEDDAPVDNYETEQHNGLTTDTLYDSWEHSVYGKRFIVAADVGIFSEPHKPPVVPDIFLSLGVNKPERSSHKRTSSYFVWIVGKVPEVVIEIVSPQEGHEEGKKKRQYAQLGILYYAVYDPLHKLSERTLTLYRLQKGRYVRMKSYWMPEVELGLMIWHGRHQESEGEWLRWCDRDGKVIPTGRERAIEERILAEQERVRAEEQRTQAQQERARAEQERIRAEQERIRAEQERSRAEEEHARAEQERARAERLAAKLRAFGIEDDTFDQ